MIQTYTQNCKLKVQSVQKIEWKQTDGQTDKRTDGWTRPLFRSAIALRFPLTRSVKTGRARVSSPPGWPPVRPPHFALPPSAVPFLTVESGGFVEQVDKFRVVALHLSSSLAAPFSPRPHKLLPVTWSGHYACHVCVKDLLLISSSIIITVIKYSVYC